MVLRRLGALLLPLVAAATVSMAFEPSAAATTTTPTTTPAKPADAPQKPAEAAAGENKEPDGTRAIYISADVGFTRPDIGGISDSTGLDKTAANGLPAGLR